MDPLSRAVINFVRTLMLIGGLLVKQVQSYVHLFSLRINALTEQGILFPLPDELVQDSLFDKLREGMGTSAFVNLRHVSSA